MIRVDTAALMMTSPGLRRHSLDGGGSGEDCQLCSERQLNEVSSLRSESLVEENESYSVTGGVGCCEAKESTA